MFALDIAIITAIKTGISAFVASTSVAGVPVGSYAVTWASLMISGNLVAAKVKSKTERTKKGKEISIPISFKVGE